MKIPEWAQQVLAEFEQRTEPFNEVEVSDALQTARKPFGDLSEEDFEGFYTEWAAFCFRGRSDQDSVWGTYFAPMTRYTRGDGVEVRSPDIKMLGPTAVAHWEQRAISVGNPVMRARYADLVWDLKTAITRERASHEYAQAGIDAYLGAVSGKYWTMPICGVRWLQRALSLAASLRDDKRAASTVAAILEFNDAVATPTQHGVWIVPFDSLCGRKDILTVDQEAKIIADLESILAKTTAPGDSFEPWGSQAAAERLAQHYKRNNDTASAHRVIRQSGQAFEELAAKADPLLAMGWLQPVYETYRNAGMTEDAKRVQIKCEEKGRHAHKSMKVISASVEISAEEQDAFLTAITADSIERSYERIAKRFITRAAVAEKMLKDMMHQAPLISMIGVQKIGDDQILAEAGPVENDVDGRLLMQLAQMIEFESPFLSLSLERAHQTYGPSVETIATFLDQSPLFPRDEHELLLDAVAAYIGTDDVKTVHLLLPQIEVAMRRLLRILGIPTNKPMRGPKGVMQKKSLNDILSDPNIEKVFGTDVMMYFRTLLNEPRGHNVRNRVLHGLAPRQYFTRLVTDRVFHVILVLSLVRGKKADGA
jgi:hypothetical protein